jgi:hypothetical protein
MAFRPTSMQMRPQRSLHCKAPGHKPNVLPNPYITAIFL